MPGAYSADLRERVVDAVSAGRSRRGASAAVKVSVSSAIRWAQRFNETGSWQAKPTGGDRRSQAIEAHMSAATAGTWTFGRSILA